MPEQPTPQHTTDQHRLAVAEGLKALALAVKIAAAVVFLLMLLVWFITWTNRATDFPGRFWFVVLPLLAAAMTLNAKADAMTNAGSR
jgi:hypothetical protein